MATTQRFDQPMQWLSRTIAVLIFMVGPGILGSLVDRWLKLSIFTPIGFGIGITLATVALLVLAKHFIPDAKGKSLTDADFDDEGEVVDELADPDFSRKDRDR